MRHFRVIPADQHYNTILHASIILTGWAMSEHAQALMLSTKVNFFPNCLVLCTDAFLSRYTRCSETRSCSLDLCGSSTFVSSPPARQPHQSMTTRANTLSRRGSTHTTSRGRKQRRRVRSAIYPHSCVCRPSSLISVFSDDWID